MSTAVDLPLFPLKTVLFPRGTLMLRIFEPRYLDMVSHCLREDRAFGVNLIRDGSETGEATMAEVGTFARIADWDRHDDGLLRITARGGERFSAERISRRKDGLNVGRIRPIAADEPARLPAEWRPLTVLLRRILLRLQARYQWSEADFDDAAWVGFRFAEVLPVALAQKQVLLEMTNPLERLRMLRPMVEAVRRHNSE